MSYPYKLLYKPNDILSDKNGIVKEHRFIASRKLGRKLLPTEVVHHIDGNKFNNLESNLMVFRTNADHSAFHSGYSATLVGDVYVCQNKPRHKCECCGRYVKDHKTKLCAKCYRESEIKASNRPSKDELFKLLQINSFVEIGKLFNVSDNAVRKWCKYYGLPFRKKDMKDMLCSTKG